MATIITNELRWKELTQQYSFMDVTVRGETINPFAEALKDGTIEAMIQSCADAMHGGDRAPVIKQLIQNCQSKQCIDRGKTVKNSAQRASEAACQLFLDYLIEMRKQLTGKTPSSRGSGTGKWRMSREEILAVTDVTQMGKIVDIMASHKSKDLSGLTDEDLTDADKLFLENYAVARQHLKELKAGAAQPNVSDKLMAKLTKGGKATLSAAEVAEIMKLLQK